VDLCYLKKIPDKAVVPYLQARYAGGFLFFLKVILKQLSAVVPERPEAIQFLAETFPYKVPFGKEYRRVFGKTPFKKAAEP
jgi:hypothetical protein